MINPEIILLLSFFITSFLTGLIWVIQVVHYPLFKNVGKEQFQSYERQHRRLITAVVFPAMIAEISLSSLLVFTSFFEQFPLLIISSFALNFLIFLSTIFYFAPIHQRLSSGYDLNTIKRLVRANWFRTAAWTLHSVLLLIILVNTFEIHSN